jgi:hypothetical protein
VREGGDEHGFFPVQVLQCGEGLLVIFFVHIQIGQIVQN